jgi:hypothetical protein
MRLVRMRSFMSVVRAEKLTLIHPIDFFGGIQWQYLRKLTLVGVDRLHGQSGHGPKSDWCVHRVDNQTGDSLPRLDRYNAMDARYRSFGNAMLSRLRQLPAPLGRVHL